MRRTKYGDRPWAVGRRSARRGRTLRAAGRPWGVDCATVGGRSARLCCDVARGVVHVPPRFCLLRGGAVAAGRPLLRRRSSDVMTAGLISSRVWFGPVPGSS
ncbi:U-box domain-containing protein 42 [Dorcoceras hygrometricum]|uniref:U-box domain-containing protein 42 n=1 Tax=Dorcoceras hygrometricum TaxID=472368 RepID=A0A2Z6ZY61_9LAMI|nr:U-box domain-containing protein 42 [Dorcoceras hygrometricum]